MYIIAEVGKVMEKVNIGEFKNKLLGKIGSLEPLTPDFWEVWLSLYIGFGKVWFGEEWREANIPNFINIEIFMKTREKEESKALADGYRTVKGFIEPLFFQNTTQMEKLVVDGLEKMKRSSLHPNDCVYNFGLKRVIDTVKRYPKSPKNSYEDFLWENIDVGKFALSVPGFRKTGMSILKNEMRVLYKICETLNMLRPGNTEDVFENLKYKVIDIDKIKEREGIKENYEASIFIVMKMEEFVEAFFPCSNTVMGQYGGLFYAAIYTKDVIFVYVKSSEYIQAVLFPFVLNNETENTFGFLLFLLERMLRVLEGKTGEFEPFVVWEKDVLVQKILPPDAKNVFNSPDVKIFISNKTRTFIHMAEEKEPYFRITFYSFKFFQRILLKENPTLDIERSAREHGASC